MQWKRGRWGRWRWRWGRIWLAGWAGGVQGELWGGAESHADIRLWQSEVWSVRKTTGEATDEDYFLTCESSHFMNMMRQSWWIEVFLSFLNCWTDRRNWAMWPMSRTQRERQQRRGGRHGWTQRDLRFLLTTTCEFCQNLWLPKTLLFTRHPLVLTVVDWNVSLQGWFVWGWWDKGAAEVCSMVGKVESFHWAGGRSWWVQVLPS